MTALHPRFTQPILAPVIPQALQIDFVASQTASWRPVTLPPDEVKPQLIFLLHKGPSVFNIQILREQKITHRPNKLRRPRLHTAREARLPTAARLQGSLSSPQTLPRYLLQWNFSSSCPSWRKICPPDQRTSDCVYFYPLSFVLSLFPAHLLRGCLPPVAPFRLDMDRRDH